MGFIVVYPLVSMLGVALKPWRLLNWREDKHRVMWACFIPLPEHLRIAMTCCALRVVLRLRHQPSASSENNGDLGGSSGMCVSAPAADLPLLNIWR